MNIDLLIISLATFAAFLDTHSLFPLISPYARSLGAPLTLVGLIVGMYSAVNAVGNLVAGPWADRAGRKVPLLMGLSMTGLALLAYTLVRSPVALLAVRILHGIGAALISPASLASVGDMADPSRRGRTMALYGIAFGSAGLLGPPLGGWVRDRWGYDAVFTGLAALMFALALAVLVGFRGWFVPGDPSGHSSPVTVLRSRRLWVSFLSAFCWTFAMGTLLVLLPLIGRELGFSSARVGMLFGAFALAAIIVQASPLSHLSDRWGRLPLIVLGLAIIAVSLMILTVLREWGMMMGAMFLYGSGFGLLFPAMSALIADEAEISVRGTASGIFTALFSLGIFVGTATAGWLAERQTLHPFILAALVVAGGALWAVVHILIHKGGPSGIRRPGP